MQKYLPSKKFLYTLLAVLFAILLVWGVNSLANRVDKGNNSEIGTINEKESEIFKQVLAVDSDEDGLKDWEEALWKTDPDIKDTDSDGTTDGQEINDNRDPLKKAPGDEFDPLIIAENKKSEAEFKKLTQTDQLAQTFFSQYIASKNNGTLSKTNKQIILDTAVSQVASTNNVTKYTKANLRISTNNSAEALKAYGNSITVGAQNNSKETIRQELSVLATAIDEEDPNELKNLEGAIKLYETIINTYLIMEVPSELTTVHLDIINNLSAIKNDVEKMKLIFSDALQAILAIDDYKKSVEKLRENFSNLGKYFQSKDIVFKENDPGYKLFNVVK